MNPSDQADSGATETGEVFEDGSQATDLFDVTGPSDNPRPAAAPPGGPGSSQPEGKLTKPAGASSPDGTVAWFPVAPTSEVGRYELLKFHARGGMGEIWLARDKEIGREVAIKRIRNEKRQSARDRFLAEAQITGQLEHPGVAPVHDLGLDSEGRPYYVMKFVRGRTLKHVLEEHHAQGQGKPASSALAELEHLEIFLQVCRTVSYAHHRGVIHRDIKPDNIMLGPYGETLLLDWGLAKLLDADEGESAAYAPLSGVRASGDTHVGSVVGTAQYMAPESASGKPEEIDQRTDIYLLGATLFEILTGQPPRRGTSNQEMVELARSAPVVSPLQLNKRAPRALAAICLKAMSRRKQDRYATADALALDVQRYLAGEPVSAHRENLSARLWRRAKRHRRGIARAAAAVAVLGLALASAALWREAERRRARDHARAQLVEFRRLSDAAHGAVGVDQAHEHAHYYDLDRGLSQGRQALVIAEGWGRDLTELPLAEEKERLRQELSELLLLVAQAEATHADDEQTTQAWRARVAWAVELSGPSLASQRLLAELLGTEGESAAAVQANSESSSPGVAATALDDFLEGEKLRLQSQPLELAPYDPFEDEPMNAAAARGGQTPTRQRLIEAARAYRSALQKNPRHYWSHVQLGRCYLALGRRPEAIAQFAAAVAVDANNPWAYSARGLALAIESQYAEANADFSRALAIDRRFAPALVNRGVARLLEGKDGEAIADFTAVLKLPEDERLPEAAWYRGQALMRRKRNLSQVLSDFALAAAKRPALRVAHLRRAEIHLAQGADPEVVLGDVDAWLDADPAADDLPLQRARELRRLVQKSAWADAIAAPGLTLALNELLSAPPGETTTAEAKAWYFDELGRIRLGLKQPRQALADWDRAIAAAPHDAVALKARLLNTRGWQLANRRQKDKLAEALRDFDEALPEDPELQRQLPWWLLGNVHLGKAFVHAVRGESDSARAEVANYALLSLENEADHWILHHNAACVYAALATHGARSENEELAITHLRQAVRLAKDQAKNQIQAEQFLPDSIKSRAEFQPRQAL